MNEDDVSPKYIMELVPIVEKRIWDMFENSKYLRVKHFILKWHKESESYNYNDYWENFHIYYKDDEQKTIDLAETLYRMPNDILLRIAIDLGIDTPGFLPAIPKFKNILKDQNQSAYQNFERAVKNVYDNPDQAVSLASSTLEGIIKTILNHETFREKSGEIKNKPLSKLIGTIIKEFGFDDKEKCPQEIITIANQLRSIGNTIDDLRSDKSTAHGKSHDEYVVNDPLWASLTVNATATVGLFIWEFFEKKYKLALQEKVEIEYDNAPIDLSEIPF